MLPSLAQIYDHEFSMCSYHNYPEVMQQPHHSGKVWHFEELQLQYMAKSVYKQCRHEFEHDK